jgi:heme-degrading monooxygenase HmoA
MSLSLFPEHPVIQKQVAHENIPGFFSLTLLKIKDITGKYGRYISLVAW